jgi:hypothetical protein
MIINVTFWPADASHFDPYRFRFSLVYKDRMLPGWHRLVLV